MGILSHHWSGRKKLDALLWCKGTLPEILDLYGLKQLINEPTHVIEYPSTLNAFSIIMFKHGIRGNQVFFKWHIVVSWYNARIRIFLGFRTLVIVLEFIVPDEFFTVYK